MRSVYSNGAGTEDCEMRPRSVEGAEGQIVRPLILCAGMRAKKLEPGRSVERFVRRHRMPDFLSSDDGGGELLPRCLALFPSAQLTVNSAWQR